MNQFDVVLVNLDPTIGSEIRKTRPCVIISPDEMNHHINTLIIAPLTHTQKNYPTRVNCHFNNEPGSIVLDQLRTIDKKRIIKSLGRLTSSEASQVKSVLVEMFS